VVLVVSHLLLPLHAPVDRLSVQAGGELDDTAQGTVLVQSAQGGGIGTDHGQVVPVVGQVLPRPAHARSYL
jgi:hypothetical protein